MYLCTWFGLKLITLSTHRVLFWPIAQTALQGQQCYPILQNDSCKVWVTEITCSHHCQEGNQPFSWAVNPLLSLTDPTIQAVLLTALQCFDSMFGAVKPIKWTKANMTTSLMTVEIADELQTFSARSRRRDMLSAHTPLVLHTCDVQCVGYIGCHFSLNPSSILSVQTKTYPCPQP